MGIYEQQKELRESKELSHRRKKAREEGKSLVKEHIRELRKLRDQSDKESN